MLFGIGASSQIKDLLQTAGQEGQADLWDLEDKAKKEQRIQEIFTNLGWKNIYDRTAWWDIFGLDRRVRVGLVKSHIKDALAAKKFELIFDLLQTPKKSRCIEDLKKDPKFYVFKRNEMALLFSGAIEQPDKPLLPPNAPYHNWKTTKETARRIYLTQHLGKAAARLFYPSFLRSLTRRISQIVAPTSIARLAQKKLACLQQSASLITVQSHTTLIGLMPRKEIIGLTPPTQAPSPEIIREAIISRFDRTILLYPQDEDMKSFAEDAKQTREGSTLSGEHAGIPIIACVRGDTGGERTKEWDLQIYSPVERGDRQLIFNQKLENLDVFTDALKTLQIYQPTTQASETPTIHPKINQGIQRFLEQKVFTGVTQSLGMAIMDATDQVLLCSKNKGSKESVAIILTDLTGEVAEGSSESKKIHFEYRYAIDILNTNQRNQKVGRAQVSFCLELELFPEEDDFEVKVLPTASPVITWDVDHLDLTEDV